MPRSEILSRYRRLRQISKEQHEAVLNIIAPDVVLDWARRIGLTQGKTVVSDSEAESRSRRIWPFTDRGRATHTRSTATLGLRGSRPAPTKQSCSRQCARPASRSGASSGITKPPV